MPTLFFYGTLRHLPLLEIVLGRSLSPEKVAEAFLPDHDVRAIVGHDFPMIKAEGPGIDGIIVRDLSEEERARFDFYEGGFDYALQPVQALVNDSAEEARVYFPRNISWQDDGRWSLTHWVETKGTLAVLAAQEVMGYFGVKSDAQLDFMFPRIRARAANRLRAQEELDAFNPGGLHRSDVIDHGVTKIHAGFFLFDQQNLSYRRYDGTQSEVVAREVFVGGDAAIVLPYDPVRDCVLVVEQFRPGPFVRGDENPWILEPIAGLVDADETPESAAYREAKEEAGLALERLHLVARSYASPGATTELYYIYVACADLPETTAGLGGLAEESEDIKSYILSYEKLMAVVDAGQAANTPLVTAALWLSRHRDRLRGMS